MGATLYLYLLGNMRLATGSRDHEVALQPVLIELLAFLATSSRRMHMRERLAGKFWPDQDDAHSRACLSSALYRLRGKLKQAGVDGAILATPTHIGVNPDWPIWSDMREFELDVGSLISIPADRFNTEDAERLGRALASYRGSCFSEVCHDWVLAERERMWMLRQHGLYRLTDHYLRGGLVQEALDTSRLLLQLDPTDEQVHRTIMGLHLAAGHRSQALRQFEQCRLTLRRELGLDPEPETMAIHADIVGYPVPGRTAEQNKAARQRQPAQQLDVLRQSLELAQKQLTTAWELSARI